MIDAPLPPGRAPKLSPEELRSRQLAALTAWVLAGARTQPIVLAFEDLHWADPTSLDVLQALAERGAQAPLLIVATTRPEFRPPWKLRSHHGVISLAPLDAGEVARMVGEIATRHALSKDVIAGVSERSGGVPLFVEEVTRLLLERGEQGGVQAIPPTLQQSLAARLDRLGSAREIAQIGAVLGRGFSHALLQAVAGLDEPALRAALDRLADAELLFVEGVAPHANYRFKHALIQDAAYDSLLKSRRQTLHRRAAEVLLASPAPEAEALAHHFTQAGQTDLAIEWWGKAGDQALRRSAFAEAISHLGKAIELSDKAGAAARRATPRDRVGQPAAEIADRLRPGRHVGQGLRRRGNESRLCARWRACDGNRRCRGAARRLLRSVGTQFVSRRAWVGPGNGRELPARSGTRGAADGGGGRASHFGIDSPLPRRFRARRGRISNRRCESTTPSETAKPSSASVWTLKSRRPLIWLSRLGASATSDAHGADGRGGRARGRIRSCPDARQHVSPPGHARNPP